jgi:hypothetical protein
MSWLATLLALATLAGTLPSSPAQDTAPASRPSDPDRLIRLLDSDDFTTREQATRDLVALGAAARDALLAAKSGGSLERQMRIAQILQGFGTRASTRPVRREAALVTVEGEAMRMADVVSSLSAQTGYALRLAEGPDRTVTLALRNVPYFEAVDRACAQAGLRPEWDPRTRSTTLRPNTEKALPAAYSGPFRVSLVMLTINRFLRFSGTSGSTATLQLRVEAEEKSQALGLMMPLRVTELVDDRARDLRLKDGTQQGAYPARFDQQRQVVTFVQLAALEADSKAIAKLELVLPVFLPVEFYEAEISSPSEGSEAGQGAFHVTVAEWKETPGRVDVRIVVTRPYLTASGPAAVAMLDDSFAFLDAEGRPIVPVSQQTNPSTTSVVHTASLPSSPAVAALRVTCLKSFEVVDFPVVFENVPLP